MKNASFFLSALFALLVIPGMSLADSTAGDLPGNIVEIKTQDNEAIRVFIDGLQSKDPKVRYSCTDKFLNRIAGSSPRETAIDLAKALSNAGPGIADEAIRELALRVSGEGNEPAGNILIELINTNNFVSGWIFASLDTINYGLRSRLVAALRNSPNPMAVDGLIKVALKDTTANGMPESDKSRIEAIEALGKSQNKKGVQPLLKILSDFDVNVKVHAIAALGQLNSPEAFEPLKKFAEDASFEHYYERMAAVKALGQSMAVPEAAKVLADVIVENSGKYDQEQEYKYLIDTAAWGLINLQSNDQIDRIINYPDEKVHLQGLKIKADLDESRAMANLAPVKAMQYNDHQAVKPEIQQAPDTEKNKVGRAVMEYKSIKTAAMAFFADTGNWPDSTDYGSGFINKINSPTKWDGPYLDKWPTSAPWGGTYSYVKKATDCYLVVTFVPDDSASAIDSAIDGGDGAAAGSVRWVRDAAGSNTVTMTISGVKNVR